MRLKMSGKKAITRVDCKRYRKAGRKEKTVILNEFVKTTGYNRKYAIDRLNKLGKSKTVTLTGVTVKLKAPKTKRPKNRKGKPFYGADVIKCPRKIWKFFWYKCGKYLAPIIRENINSLEKNDEIDFHITPAVKSKLLKISPATIDRRLKRDRDNLKTHGLSGTRSGPAALMKQIPIRTHYSNSQRNEPGYFQTDTVHHCSDSTSGEYNLTLTVTDVATGWTILCALLNKAFKWTLANLKNIYQTNPFKVIEFHSDNGGEFINNKTVDWWKLTEKLELTRSRSHHSNDNCFAEQKNNAFVRNYIGYYRFDTPAERAALANVYVYLCPLLNYFIPNKKLVSKTVAGSKTLKKYDSPKTPYQRLIESDISAKEKTRLTEIRSFYNLVNLQHNVHKAVDALLKVHNAKYNTVSDVPNS